VYDRPGRVIKILGLDDAPESIMLGQPFVKDQTGRPQPAQEGQPGAQLIDLAAGEYSVVVEIGRSYSTRREEAAASMGDIMAAAPQLAPIIAPYWIEEQDWPGAQNFSDILKKGLPPQFQPEKDGAPPPEVQLQQAKQQLQQMGQMLDLTTKELNAKSKVIETEQVQNEAKAELERQKQHGETHRAHLDNQAKLELERLRVAGELLKIRATLEVKQTTTMIDAAIGEVDAEIEQAGMREARESASLEAEKQRQFQRDESDAARQHEGEMAAGQQSFDAAMAEQPQTAEPAE